MPTAVIPDTGIVLSIVGENQFTYAITIGKDEYKIDFDQMVQISAQNKQRKIQRVDLPKDNGNIHQYLQNHHKVKGLAGVAYV